MEVSSRARRVGTLHHCDARSDRWLARLNDEKELE
jgi:hypothetical protein